jgi:hypothetical protein
MGEVWVITCEYTNVAAVLKEAMPGAFYFTPAHREGATVAHSKLDVFIERRNATLLAPLGLDTLPPFPHGFSDSPVFDLDAQASLRRLLGYLGAELVGGKEARGNLRRPARRDEPVSEPPRSRGGHARGGGRLMQARILRILAPGV